MNAVVKTRQGEVRGRRVDGGHAFKGLPYAAPPFGAHRVRPPQPVEPWSGVRDALTFGAEPLHLRPDPQIQALAPDPAVPGEDCLNLNGYQALAAYGLPVETALAAYRAAYPGASPGELLAAVQTDWWCRIPAIRLAEAHAKSPAATYMYAAWVAFATSGDPGWPKYDLGRRATMRFDTTLEVVDDPRSVERTLWAGVR